MPTLAQAQRESRGFLGVNLRRDRLSLGEMELARAINADLHTVLGSIRLRLGRTPVLRTALNQHAVRRLARVNGVRYIVADDRLYRSVAGGLTSVVAQLHSSNVTTIEGMRPLNDSTLWAFIADILDGTVMYKDNGTTTSQWGITAPTTAPTAAAGPAGSLSGAYRAVVTFVRKVGDNVAHESNPSPASNSVTLASQQLQLDAIPETADPQVTHRRVYRTTAGGTQFLFETEIAVAGPGPANFNTADLALGALVDEENDPPPPAAWVALFQEHLFLCRDPLNPHYLWFSKRFRPESVPASNFIEVGNADDPLQCAVPYAGQLGVFSRRTKYRIIGSETSGFTHFEGTRRGTPAPLATIPTELGIIFPARDGIWLTPLGAADTELSQAIEPLFYGETRNDYAPINWGAAHTMAAAVWKGRYYLALPTGASEAPNLVAVYSRASGQWFFYDYVVRSLFSEEDTNLLLAGGMDGQVYSLESGTDDAGTPITLDVEHDEGGASADERATRKLFLWATLDTEGTGETLTVQLYVDGTLRRTTTVAAGRGRRLVPFPAGCLGFIGRTRITYTGRTRVAVHAIKILWQPLEAA